MTAHALKQFLEMDLNKDRFISEDEFKKAQEAEAAKIRAIVQTLIAGAARTAPSGAAATARRPAGPGAAALRPAAGPAPRHALEAKEQRSRGTGRYRGFFHAPAGRSLAYSTVTLFARLRGWSTSVPLAMAV